MTEQPTNANMQSSLRFELTLQPIAYEKCSLSCWTGLELELIKGGIGWDICSYATWVSAIRQTRSQHASGLRWQKWQTTSKVNKEQRSYSCDLRAPHVARRS